MDLPRPVLVLAPLTVFLALVAVMLLRGPEQGDEAPAGAPEEPLDAGEDPASTRSPAVPLDPGDQAADGVGPSRVQEGQAVSPPSKARTWKGGARSRLSLPPARAPHPAPDNAVTRDTIQAAVSEVLPDIRQCVEAWMALDPGLEGHVVVELHLGPQGLMDSAIADHDGVPLGVQSCFATAMVEAPWPAPPDGEFVVRYPFTFFGVDSVQPLPTAGAGEPNTPEEAEDTATQ